MKILVVGPKKPHFFETACAQVFSACGCEVLQFDNKPERWWLGYRDWFQLTQAERLVQDLSASAELYRVAKQFRPDIIFVCKAENIRSEVYTLLKRDIGCRLVVWYVDNPFHSNVSSYQALRAIQKADFYFIWAEYLIAPLISAGCQSVSFLPFAYNAQSNLHNCILDCEESTRYKSDICFVGTWDVSREKALEPLAGKSFDLAIYGQGWKKFLSDSSPLQKHVRADSIWLEDSAKAFKGAKIVLNFLRQHNWTGHNFRTMEATGIGGGALATPWTRDQAEKLFKVNTEILCFDGTGPTPELVSEWLEQPSVLAQIAQAGQARVFSQHLLHHRINEILTIISSN
jgi:spore maturation protein CgeB